jgi:hypothetical protein
MYKKLTPSYGRNTTTATILLSQPNTIILVEAFPEPFECQSDDVVGNLL